MFVASGEVEAKCLMLRQINYFIAFNIYIFFNFSVSFISVSRIVHQKAIGKKGGGVD